MEEGAPHHEWRQRISASEGQPTAPCLPRSAYRSLLQGVEYVTSGVRALDRQLLVCDGVQSPSSGNTFEIVVAAIAEADAGTRHEISHGTRHPDGRRLGK